MFSYWIQPIGDVKVNEDENDRKVNENDKKMNENEEEIHVNEIERKTIK